MEKVLAALVACLIIFSIRGHANSTAYTNVADTGTYYYHAHHSLKSGIVRSVIKIIGIKKRTNGADESVKDKLRSFTKPSPVAKFTKGLTVTDTLFMGQHVYTLTPEKHANHKVIFYLHGGAFVLSFIKPHWRFIQQLAKQTHCTIVAPDYPLSPEHDYKERFAMLEPLYAALAARAGTDSIIIIGDSSGGNLALAMAQEMKKKGMAPQQVILLSPWLDVSMTNPDIAAADARDPLLTAKGALFVGRIHAGADSLHLKDPLISPLYGPLQGVGRISTFTGTDDVLNPDAEKLRRMLVQQGINNNFYEYRRMIHTFMLFKMPEGKRARKQVYSLVND